MVQTSLDTNAASLIINLVTFTVQTSVPTIYRFAFSDKDFTDGFTWDALPEGSIKFKEFSGSPKEEPVQIDMKKVEPFITALVGEPHQTIDVTIEEVDPRFTSTRRVLYVGQVRKITENVNSQTDRIRLNITGLKFLLDRALGLECVDWCSWRFGDSNCAFDVEAETTTDTVASIQGTLVTLTTPVTVPRLRRGRLRRDGVEIVIKEQLNETQVQLIEFPPAGWAGQSVDVVVGCDKTVDACHGLWNNLENFGGFGLKMLAYHPVIEQI